jgi:hypothetical protein
MRNKLLIFTTVGLLAVGILGLMAIMRRTSVLPDTSDLVPVRPDLPDDQNAYPVFTNAAAMFHWPANDQPLRDYIDAPTADDTLIRETIDRNTDTLNTLTLGLERPMYLPPEIRDYNDPIPHLSSWRNMARLQALKVRADRMAGRHAAAVDACITLLRFGDMLTRDAQVTIHYLVGVAVVGIGLTQAQDIARDPTVPQEQRTRIMETLNGFTPFDIGLVKALKGEHNLTATAFDRLLDGTLTIEDFMGDGPSSAPSGYLDTFQTLFWNVMTGLLFDSIETRQALAIAFRNAIQAAPLPYSAIDPRFFESLYFNDASTTTHFSRFNLLGRGLFNMVGPDVESVLKHKIKMECTLSATRLIFACHAYRQIHGRLPAALSDLAPDHLPDIPNDPFDGQPLRYDAQRGIIYSVGSDLVDQGGDDAVPGGRTDWYRSPDVLRWQAPDAVFAIDAPETMPPETEP